MSDFVKIQIITELLANSLGHHVFWIFNGKLVINDHENSCLLIF